MKTIHKIFIVAIMLFITGGMIVSCSSTKNSYSAVTDVEEEFKIDKSGAQLWGETCNRCHLAPSPADYNDTDWETIGLHMRVRANLTEKEITKIETFLKSAN
jgi:cytochrome c5